MRWMWIDRFLEFECGKRAKAVKCVSMVEAHIDDYLPGMPVMPAPLIVEGLAQTAGLLVNEMSGFRSRVVLAKISKAVFHFHAQPGDQLTYEAELQSVQDDGAVANARATIDGKLQTEVEFMFAFLDETFAGKSLFNPDDLLRMIRTFGLYEGARNADGTPALPPPHLAAAEEAHNARRAKEWIQY